jgi:hypothetical protein
VAKPKVPSVKKLEELYEDYDKARTDAKEAENAKKEAGDAIKTLLGDTEEASTPRYIVTYKFDKDRETEVFDEEKFEEKDPKGYAAYLIFLEDIKRVTKKYTKTVTVKGARKLIVTAKEE